MVDSMAPDNSTFTELQSGRILQLIPDYNTDKSGEIYRFVRSCDAAFQLANAIQKNILLVYALNKISGTGAPDVHSRKHVNRDALRTFLINRFSNVKTISHLMLELQSMFEKPNENIIEYFHRVELCRSKIIEKLTAEVTDNTLAGRKSTTEETALNVFINGLSSDIGTMLRTKTYTTLFEAGRFALQEDKIRAMNQARQALFKIPISSNSRATVNTRSVQRNFTNFNSNNRLNPQPMRSNNFANF